MEIKKGWRTVIFKYQDKVFSSVHKLYKSSWIVDYDKKNNSSTLRKFYGLPKVHKRKDNDVLLRPILSTIGTNIYELSKFLVALLAGVSPSVNTIKDSFSFASETCKTRNNDRFIASFDVDRYLLIFRSMKP